MNLIRDILPRVPRDPRRTEMKEKTKKTQSSQTEKKDNLQFEKVKNQPIKDMVEITPSSKDVELGPVDVEKYARLLKKMPDKSKPDAVKEVKVKIDTAAYTKSEVIEKIAEKILSTPIFKDIKLEEPGGDEKSLRPPDVEQIKVKMKSGSYDSDPIVDKIAESILKLFNRI